MEKMIAKCGLVCTECEGFIATQENDIKKLQEIANMWSEKTGKEILIENLLCDGCLSAAGRLSGYCSICKIRKCAEEKNLDNCAICADYICSDLAGFLNQAPKAKENLENIRNG